MNLIVNGVMEKINRLIVQRSTCMTENQFAAEIKEWKASPRRGMQIKGSDYYEGRHEILNRQRTAIGRDGNLVPVKNLPNNKLIDNQYAKAVDQKVNYFVGKPFTVSCEDQTYSDLLAGYFNRGFFRQLKYLAEDALNNGLAWLYPYYGEDGHLAFKRFSGYEVLPFWADDDHTRLDCAARLYTQEVWNGYTKETVEKVELFRKDGIHRYIFQNDMLLPDTAAGEYETYFTGPGPDGPDTGYNWERIPLIPFKYNKQELPLIQRVKCLQDAINTLLSDFTNNMQEDARNTILILRNYDGEDLGKFRENLSAYGAVKVRDDGGVEKLIVEVNSDNYKAMDLSAFLAENAIPPEEEAAFVVSKRFLSDETDKKGNRKPLQWKLKAITGAEDESLRKSCVKRVPVPGRRNQYQQETDYNLYLGKLAVACTVYPNLNDKALQDSYKVMGAENLLKTMLTSGEYAEYLQKVQEVCGFDVPLQDEVDDAKN